MSEPLSVIGIIVIPILLLVLFLGIAFSLSWALWEIIFPAIDKFMDWAFKSHK